MQRRLAAILGADVVGYSRLMGGDEAGTHRRFSTDGSGLAGSNRGHATNFIYFLP
jgi:hypothetical protein